MMSKSAGSTVLIEADGKLYAKYSLLEDQTVEVERKDAKGRSYSNTVVIKDGKVTVTESTCVNQVCVKHGAIDQAGESIICLPNKLIVKIEGKGGGGYDTISS